MENKVKPLIEKLFEENKELFKQIEIQTTKNIQDMKMIYTPKSAETSENQYKEGDYVQMFSDEPKLQIVAVNEFPDKNATYDLRSDDGKISRNNISADKFMEQEGTKVNIPVETKNSHKKGLATWFDGENQYYVKFSDGSDGYFNKEDLIFENDDIEQPIEASTEETKLNVKNIIEAELKKYKKFKDKNTVISISDLLRNYFNVYVTKEPLEYKYLLSINEKLPKTFRVTFGEINDYFHSNKDSEARENFLNSLKEQHLSIWDVIPDEYKNVTPTKKITWKPNKDDEGLKKIMSSFVGTNDLRTLMMGVYFDDNGIVATNAHILAFLPAKVEEKGIYCIEKGCFENVGKEKLDGNYPNYSAVIPSNDYWVDVHTDSLLEYINGTNKAGLVNDRTKQIAFSYDDQFIGFNSMLMKTCLIAMRELGYSEVSMSLASNHPSRAVLFTPKGQTDNYTITSLKVPFTLLMPVMLRDEEAKLFHFNLDTQCIKNSKIQHCLHPVEKEKIKFKKATEKVEALASELQAEKDKIEAEKRAKAEEEKERQRLEEERLEFERLAKEEGEKIAKAKEEKQQQLEGKKQKIAERLELLKEMLSETKDKAKKEALQDRIELLEEMSNEYCEGGMFGGGGEVKEYPKLRSVRVTYDNGEVIPTSMAAHLTDEEIRNYFKVGRTFNIGSTEDRLAKVAKVEILFENGGTFKEIKKSEIEGFAKNKDLGNIEKETDLLPYIIADGIANDRMRDKYKKEFDNWKNLSKEQQSQLDNKVKADSDNFIDYLVDRAETHYLNNKIFKNQLNAFGNKGRDYLYTFMNHWADAYEKDMFEGGGDIDEQPTKIQSVIFKKKLFNKQKAKAWLKKNNFETELDEQKNVWRARQYPPENFKQDSFRTIELTKGVQAVIGKEPTPVEKNN